MTHRFLPHHVCPHCCLLTTAIIIAHHSSVGSLLSRLECKGEIRAATMREKELLSDSRYSHRSHQEKHTTAICCAHRSDRVSLSLARRDCLQKARIWRVHFFLSPGESHCFSLALFFLARASLGAWSERGRMSRKAKSLGTNPGSSSLLSQRR